jgi:hypothetical protein
LPREHDELIDVHVEAGGIDSRRRRMTVSAVAPSRARRGRSSRVSGVAGGVDVVVAGVCPAFARSALMTDAGYDLTRSRTCSAIGGAPNGCRVDQKKDLRFGNSRGEQHLDFFEAEDARRGRGQRAAEFLVALATPSFSRRAEIGRGKHGHALRREIARTSSPATPA